jgi:Spy/CpxP family protein refolding chaperone
MKKKGLLLALGLGVLAVVGVGAYAAGAPDQIMRMHHHGHGPVMAGMIGGHVEEMLDELDATEAQRQQVNRIKDRLLADGRALHAEGLHQDLLAILRQERPDPTQLYDRVDAHAEAMKAFGHKLADAALEVHDILTPEQRQKLAAHVRAHAERR